MSSNNVIMFPKNKKETPPQTLEEVQAQQSEIRSIRVDDFVEQIMVLLIGSAFEEGFDLTTPEFANHNIFIIEAIRAALLKTQGVEHPFQTLAEAIVSQGAPLKIVKASDLTEDQKAEFLNFLKTRVEKNEEE